MTSSFIYNQRIRESTKITSKRYKKVNLGTKRDVLQQPMLNGPANERFQEEKYMERKGVKCNKSFFKKKKLITCIVVQKCLISHNIMFVNK